MLGLCLPHPERNKARSTLTTLGMHPRRKRTTGPAKPPARGAQGAYRAVEDHQALVEVVVLQGGVAVQLSQRVLAPDGTGRVVEGGRKGDSHQSARHATLPIHFLWLTHKIHQTNHFLSFG